MATLHTSSAARLMIAPSVVLLFAWMIVPLVMTIYFSLLNYNLLNPGVETWAGFTNYSYFLTDPGFVAALVNTIVLVVGVLMITVIGGIAMPNIASVALHEKLGMRKVAHFAEVGFKLGRWVDVGYWQKVFPS